MAQTTTGLRALCSLPRLYSFCMNILGGRKVYLELIRRYIRPKSGMRILDLGCGPAEILALLPEDIEYVGVDLSQAYIEAAEKAYGGRGKFRCIPVESMRSNALGRFDLVLGLGLLHHLDDVQCKSFFSLAAEVLQQEGRCLAIDPCFVDGQHALARWLIARDRGRNVRTPVAYAAMAQPFFPRQVQHIHHDLLRIPYTHHVMECCR